MLLIGLPAQALACEIESYRFYPFPISTPMARLMDKSEPDTSETANLTVIEGAASCRSGDIYIRVYDENGDYLGNAIGEITEYALYALLTGPAPKTMILRIGAD